jgi:hypothetical protein
MKWNLFIDDERAPLDVKWGTPGEKYIYLTYEWFIARNLEDVLNLIKAFGMPSLISFDHDLGEDSSYNGYEISQKIADMILDGEYKLPHDFQFIVHSKNPVGAANIRGYMNNFLKHMEGLNESSTH